MIVEALAPGAGVLVASAMTFDIHQGKGGKGKGRLFRYLNFVGPKFFLGPNILTQIFVV